MRLAIAAVGALLTVAAAIGWQAPASRKGVALAELAWPDAEAYLTSSAVVVIPLGAGALEQGPHMKLDSDERLARHFAARVTTASAVVVAPPLNYHFYPAYAGFAGSTSLGETSARDVIVDAVRSLARPGPRRFYVLNTSPSTLRPLSAAARVLADAGILLGYTDPAYWLKQPAVLKQAPIPSAHADEAATSMMLFVDRSAVDMTKAKREYPDRGSASKSGTLGDATLATPQKGEALTSALLAGMLADIENVRTAPLPDTRSAPPPAPAPPPRPERPPEQKMPTGCTASEDRTVRGVADRFTYLWTQQDAPHLAGLFTPMGDIRHPDGTIERGQEVILSDLLLVFGQKAYANSRYRVQLTDIRCVGGGGVAIADGKWELRLENAPQSTPGRVTPVAPLNSGWCTLTLLKAEGASEWHIEAWRYTINAPPGSDQPVLLAKPGYTGRGGE